MNRNFVFLGATDYALSILKKIITISEDKPFCLIDAKMTIEKKKKILDIFSNYLTEDDLYDSSLLKEQWFLERLQTENLMLALSVNFSEILNKNFLEKFKHGVINLHQSFLPYNRGHWPEIWSIINGTPAGITLHYIDEDIDTGSIIKQIPVDIHYDDTGGSLCEKIEAKGFDLIEDCWKELMTSKKKLPPQTQKFKLNTQKDLNKILNLDLNKTYKGIEIINILRSLTIPNFLPGAYFNDPLTGDKIYVNVNLSRESNQQVIPFQRNQE